ncbi:MAG: hypothetical protein J6C64_04085 [Lachnospiraceae bacterium]|nr:hypothetical protein [Lachnospiraceae bacterium]
MGFLNNLLNKEAKKIISGVMDSVADTVTDSARDILAQKGVQVKGKDKWESELALRKAKNSDEDDCRYDTSVVRGRIEKIISENWSDCELRQGISASEIGAYDIDWKYSYGVYRDGKLLALINILENPNDYKRKIVLQSKAACQNSNIGYVHFLMHLPNRSSYISQRLHDIIPA